MKLNSTNHSAGSDLPHGENHSQKKMRINDWAKAPQGRQYHNQLGEKGLCQGPIKAVIAPPLQLRDPKQDSPRLNRTQSWPDRDNLR